MILNILMVGVYLAGVGQILAAEPTAMSPIPEKLAHSVIKKYSALAFQEYSLAVQKSVALQKAVLALTEKPGVSTHLAAKKAWFRARDAYSMTEPFRFYGGPIDEPKRGPETLINSWPIDEAYIDSVKGQPGAGIINNLTQFPVINRQILLAANTKNGERNVSTGFHAMEFLLWGQDHSLSGPGDRSFNDYDPSKTKTAGRRGVYLKVLAELLVEHLSSVRDQWDPLRPENYGKSLMAEPLEESLRKIYTGLISLSIDEMSGERMTVALEKSDQENEQDCFSDYTLDDLSHNEQGIRRVYFEAGLHDLVKALSPKLARTTVAALDLAQSALRKIPAPFDRVIASAPGSSSRGLAQKAIEGLQEQGKQIAESGKRMGLVLNVQ